MLPVLVASLMALFAAPASGQELCGTKSLCKEMTTCAEAKYFLDQCGLGRLDADKDGIPCESVCGKSDATMAARMNAQPFAASSADGSALGLTSNAAPAEAEFQCGSKRTCRQMNSCAEATFHFESCGVQSLDGNGDGIACNGLCS
jgi:hypothetical protein